MSQNLLDSVALDNFTLLSNNNNNIFLGFQFRLWYSKVGSRSMISCGKNLTVNMLFYVSMLYQKKERKEKDKGKNKQLNIK